MAEPTKSSVYRQLYHAANGMESRYTRPSRSSPLDGGSSLPLTSPKVIATLVGLGTAMLGAYALMKEDATPKKNSEDAEEVQSGKELDQGSPVEELPDELEKEIAELEGLEKSDLDSRWWDGIFEAIGLRKRPVGEGSEADSVPESGTPSPVQTPELPGERPNTKSVTSPSTRAKPGDKGPPETSSSPILIARNAKLKKGDIERKRHATHELFTGKYARLSKAHLTGPELRWAMRLIREGVSISGRFGKSMLPLVRKVIVQRAEAHGLDPEAMLRMASMESGGDPNAVSGTGAIGVYQFVGPTANSFGLRNRFDLDANVEAGMLLAKANIKFMGGKDGPLQVYIAHQIGAPAAKVVFNSPPSKLIKSLPRYVRKNISHNVGKNSRTVGEYLEANRKKLEDTYRQQLAAAPFAGKLEVLVASNKDDVKVSSSSIQIQPMPGEESHGLVPTTVVVASEVTPSNPDTKYSHKQFLQDGPPMTIPPQVAEGEKSVVASAPQENPMDLNDGVEIPHIEGAFRLHGNGPLVVT